MKIYSVQNSDYEEKKVVAENMLEALRKYDSYLHTALSYDYSPMKILESVTAVQLIGNYEEEDLIK